MYYLNVLNEGEVTITWKKITSPTYTTKVGYMFKEKYILNTSCFCTFILFTS